MRHGLHVIKYGSAYYKIKYCSFASIRTRPKLECPLKSTPKRIKLYYHAWRGGSPNKPKRPLFTPPPPASHPPAPIRVSSSRKQGSGWRVRGYQRVSGLTPTPLVIRGPKEKNQFRDPNSDDLDQFQLKTLGIAQSPGVNSGLSRRVQAQSVNFSHWAGLAPCCCFCLQICSDSAPSMRMDQNPHFSW